jgi:hypothetical protein
VAGMVRGLAPSAAEAMVGGEDDEGLAAGKYCITVVDEGLAAGKPPMYHPLSSVLQPPMYHPFTSLPDGAQEVVTCVDKNWGLWSRYVSPV